MSSLNHVWKDVFFFFFCSREGNLTAALLTCTPLNEEVLTLHYAVMMVLELVAVLHLTPIRVSSLFDIWAQDSLGGGLSEEPVKKKGRSNAALKKQQMKVVLGIDCCFVVVGHASIFQLLNDRVT